MQTASADRWWARTPIPLAVVGLALLAGLALAANRLAAVSPKALEYPLWAVALGLAGNVGLRLAGLRGRILPALRTELFLKTGLVLLGAGVNLAQVTSVGARGMLQALVMVSAVFVFTWWLGGRFKLDAPLRALMAAAIAICGVSAAIAAAGAVLARKEHLAYVTALVIVTALPLMVLMPWAAQAMGLAPEWAGAWFGGNIDTTAAVVGAGALYGETAMQVASIVKMSQNALLGVAAFLLASYWALRVERRAGERPSLRLIWDRFPKFVLGFMAVSLLASAGMFDKTQLGALQALRNWAFTLAFVSIGLEFAWDEFRKVGVRPLVVYLIATVFNTVLALGAAAAIFGGVLQP